MSATFKPARNHYIDDQGYEVNRFICENAPTNSVRPIAQLQGHGYEKYSVGNGAGYRWMGALREKTCPRCGGKMISINTWQPQDLSTLTETYEFKIKTLGLPWEEIQVSVVKTYEGVTPFDTDRQAAQYAASLADTYRQEVRFNRQGSPQGHYIGQSFKSYGWR